MIVCGAESLAERRIMLRLKKAFDLLKYITLLAVVLLAATLLFGIGLPVGLLVIIATVSFALYCMGNPKLKGNAFTAWVFVSVSIAMICPPAFGTWFGFDLKYLMTPLIQTIMFGMGTTLSVQDFSRVIAMPWPVFVGFFLQYTVMPFVGLGLAILFGFEPEIAAGIVLIGSCPGGVASNLMAYLAGGNVALSVTMTSCSTLLSPVMTPFLMKFLAGRMVPINFMEMMLSILNMIIVPIVAGLIANRILYGKNARYGAIKFLLPLALGCLTAGFGVIYIDAGLFGSLAVLKTGIIIGLLLVGIVALLKLIITEWLHGPANWMDKTLPVVSMTGICFIIGIITARSSEKLLSVGLLLILASVLHNTIGYTLGYWLSRFLKLNVIDSRTVAIEVGMQNGGMASGLAMEVLKSANAALAPAIFGPWMNVSGSILAAWWHRKPVNK